MNNISVYQYFDYRLYLKDYFSVRKKVDPKFSHRYLSRRIGLTSPNFIMMVMQGKRNLTRTLASKLSAEFKHDSKEMEYFECIVDFTQADTLDEKNRLFNKLSELRCTSDVGMIEKNQYDYYTNWYNPVIRELVTDSDFNNDFKKLAARTLPRITEPQAKRSLKLLLKLNLIRLDKTTYRQNAPLISTGPQVSSLVIANYHRTMAQQAAEAMNTTSKEERDMTSCTISLSKVGFDNVRETIAECRRKVMEIAGAETSSERVYQMNFHLFPVSGKFQTSNDME